MRLRSGQKKRSPKIASKHVVTRHGKKRMRFKCKKCHHRNNVVSRFLPKKKHGLCFSFILALFALRQTVAVRYTSFSPSWFFCTPCKTQFGDHFSTTCGNLLATSLSSTLFHEPCSPNLAFKIIICPGPPRTSTSSPTESHLGS